jgi:hypothetical protein
VSRPLTPCRNKVYIRSRFILNEQGGFSDVCHTVPPRIWPRSPACSKNPNNLKLYNQLPTILEIMPVYFVFLKNQSCRRSRSFIVHTHFIFRVHQIEFFLAFLQLLSTCTGLFLSCWLSICIFSQTGFFLLVFDSSWLF